MSDADKDEERDAQKGEQQNAQVDDLDVAPEEAEDVKGGKVQMQDFHFTKTVDKSSPL